MADDQPTTSEDFSLTAPMSKEEERRKRHAARQKARRATPEPKAKKAARRATPEAKAKKADEKFKRRYKLTLAERDTMIAAQGKRCLCCKTPFGLLKLARPNVDHSHSTGRIRGILCGKCNMLLGHADDSPETLLQLVRYLEKSDRKAVGDDVARRLG